MTVKTPFGSVEVGEIYKHFKGNFYKIVSVGKLHESAGIYLVTYHQCTEEGMYQTIRTNVSDENSEIVFQPFVTDITRWNDSVLVDGVEIERFKLVTK